MEKILLALDARNHNTKAIDFACYIGRLTRSRITGIFLENLLSEDPRLIQTTEGAVLAPGGSPAANKATSDGTEANIELFKEACGCREVVTLVHRDRGVPASEILSESRFADMIIIDPETSFSRAYEKVPGRFVKDVLQEAECPVLISPYSFESIDTIYFAYNGTKSSVFAIKQFTYLFPELRNHKVIVVNAHHNSETAIEEQFKMKEWLKSHYNEVEFEILHGDPADELFGYLLDKKNGIVVMGAYGRSMLSRFFKPSHAKLIVKTVNLPIFIAHF